jgi:prolyl-tRNA editing enzyme YbaK/EbsC (Cys-tRNA(Pro) deacylase)
MMNAEQILERTGYPCGGVPSFGFNATFLIDKKVMEKEFVYTSGGSENSLIRISAKELQKANMGIVADIRN